MRAAALSFTVLDADVAAPLAPTKLTLIYPFSCDNVNYALRFFMIDAQARGRMSNSAANSLLAAKPGKNSAAARLGQIVPKPLISRKFST
jgi:hypothetical protein